MKNNKGFTVVELLASFVLTMIIVVFLFEIVLELRNVYINETVRTEVINKNTIVANSINDMLEDKTINNVTCSNTSCTINVTKTVTSSTGTSDANENKIISVSGKTVTVGSQKIKFPEKVTLGSLNFNNIGPLSTQMNADNSFIKIGYKVESADLNKPIEFNFVYPYMG